MMKRSTRSPFKRKSHSRDNSIEERGFFHAKSASGSNIPSAQHSRQASGGGLNIGPPVSGNNPSSHKRTVSNSSRSSQNSNFLAEQYDRDRRAILASCFSEDTKSSGPPNNYITHVRIIEDSRSPSSRPPPDSKLENKKKRILILSSKPNNPNALQLHKGRENPDGRFQIGRTWDLKELVSIERDLEVNEGFTLTMSKRYYWETNSAKERVVFIKSLVSIYMQAFEGHVPELINWDLSMFYLDERTYQRAVIRNKNSQLGKSSISPSIGTASTSGISGTSSGSKGGPSIATVSNTRIANPNPVVLSQKSPTIAQGMTSPLNDPFVQGRQMTATAKPTKPTSPNVSGYSSSPTFSNGGNSLYEQHYEQQRQRQETTQRRVLQQGEDQHPEAHQIQRWKSIQTQNDPQVHRATVPRHQAQAQQVRQKQTQHTHHHHHHRQAQFEQEARQVGENGIQTKPSYSHPFSPQLNSSSNAPESFMTKQPRMASPEMPQLKRNRVKQGTPISMESEGGQSDIPSRSSGSQNKQDTLLEDLNNVLADPSNMSTFSDNYSKVSQEKDRTGDLYTTISSRKTSSPMGIAPLSIPNVEPLNVAATPTMEKSSLKLGTNNTADAMDDLNASSLDGQQDDGNDLSFQRGDEVSFNTSVIPNSPHVYHEVSTIQEEVLPFDIHRTSGNTTGTVGDSPEDRKKDSKKEAALLVDEELLGILTDINWEVGDAADDLIEKLDLKMAETTYFLNNGLLSLENMGPSLLPYENQVSEVCDKMNPIFSLFLMEMGNVAEDIEYIEGQKNGLQIESANKKNLWSTLSELMNTVSLDDATLNELLNSPVSEKTLLRMESHLKSLFRALKAIRGASEEENYDLGNMQALKERREAYERVINTFLRRLVNALSGMFVNIYKDNTTEDHLTSFLNRLLIFSSLTLFCRDVDRESYNMILDKWISSIQVVYDRICEKMILKLRSHKLDKRERQTAANENALDSLLIQWENYKKTKTLPEVAPSSAKSVAPLKNSLESLGNLCICYQNFISSFFHVSSSLDFEEYLEQHADPSTRIVQLYSVKPMQSDRESALKEESLVSRIFRSNVAKMASHFATILKADTSRGPAVMLFLEEKIKNLESSNQEFLLTAMSQMLEQVKQLWSEYIEDEVLHLERAVINMSSRDLSPSVLGFVLFVKNSHDYILYAQSKSDVKGTYSFSSIKLFESDSRRLGNAVIKLLKKEDGGSHLLAGVRSAASGTDRIVTLLLNSYWLLEVLSMLNMRGSFDATIQAAKKIFDSEKEIYASYLLRDAMPKLTSFVHGASSLMGPSSQGTGANLAKSAAYSRQNLENILSGYTSAEINTLVKRLYRQMLRHLSHESNDLMRGTLCDRLWSSIQGQTVSLYLKLYTLIEKQYKGALVRFTKNDIITAFETYKE